MTSFTALTNFTHGQKHKIGVVVCNLGTPDAPDTGAVRSYLAQFLSDKRVVELSDWLWKPILHGVILRIRPGRSAAAYRKVWTENGSPLLDISKRQVAAISDALNRENENSFAVELGMRYGEPSIGSALQALREQQVRKIIVLPLYPQYASATTGSVFDAVATEIAQWRWVPELHFVNEYYNDSRYLDALAASVEKHWRDNGRNEHLLMSFHGIPEEYFLAGDPYFCHCQATGRELAKRLSLNEDCWQITFQSRVGRQQWLQPYTDLTVAALAKNGTKSLDVVCPGFSADCLETVEEIAMQNAEIFADHGGQAFSYIPALNDNDDHVALLSELIRERCQGWLADLAHGALADDEQRQAIKERAQALAKSAFPNFKLDI
ncbi:MAG: ferrochelatase [Gammaproteobacteria bacterium]